MSQNKNVSATDLISNFLYERWPEVVPINVVVIMEGLNTDNNRSLFAISNTDCPPWTIHGMLELVAADNRFTWEMISYQGTNDETILETELEDDDE